MQLSGVISEATRNVASGTTRVLAFSLTLASAAIVLGLVDGVAVDRLVRDGVAFRASGAAVWVMSAPQMVNGAACDRLTLTANVTASGAVRRSGAIEFSVAPGTELPIYDVTPGMPAVVHARAMPTYGLILSDTWSQRLGVHEGVVADLVGLDGRITGTFPYPHDGRAPALEDAVLEIVEPGGAFDECWMEVWPSDERAPVLARSVLYPDARDTVELSQLNTRLGDQFRGWAIFRSRPTRHASFVGAGVGALLGYGSIRARRLELASALHARVPKASLLAQVVLESVAWVTSGLAVGLALVWREFLTGKPVEVGVFAVRPMVAVGVGALIGAAAATALVRERQLLALFRER